MFSKYFFFIKNLRKDIEEKTLHKFICSRKAIQAVHSEYPCLDLAGIVLEKIKSEKAEFFEDRVNVGESLEDFFVVIIFERIVDVEIDITCKRVQSL